MKVSKIAGIIAKARHYLELKNLKELCNTMVYPYLTYCNINWASTYPTRLRSIYIAQKKMVRLVTFSSFRETSQPLFKLSYLIANFMYSRTHVIVANVSVTLRSNCVIETMQAHSETSVTNMLPNLVNTYGVSKIRTLSITSNGAR